MIWPSLTEGTSRFIRPTTFFEGFIRIITWKYGVEMFMFITH